MRSQQGTVGGCGLCVVEGYIKTKCAGLRRVRLITFCPGTDAMILSGHYLLPPRLHRSHKREGHPRPGLCMQQLDSPRVHVRAQRKHPPLHCMYAGV